MRVSVAFATSSSYFNPQPTFISILLCPLHTHTSPVTTSFITILLYPFIEIVNGPPSAGVGTDTSHFAPEEPVAAYVAVSQLTFTLTFSFASAHPHNLTV